MGRKLLFILLLVMSFLPAKTQNYIPLLDTASMWDVAERGMGGFCWAAPPRRYFISGDTVINSIKFANIYYYTSTNATNAPPWCPPFYLDSVPHPKHIFLREDTIQRLVYEYDIDNELEWVIFDFNLVAGEEFFGLTVDTVYYRTFADGITRKVIDFDYDGSSIYALIEGIGGNCGPFEPPCVWFENFSVPTCYKRNGMNVFYNGCSDMISVDVSNIEPTVIKYFPNPVIDKLYIETPFKDEPYEIQVIDALGHFIMKLKASGMASIDFNGLQHGMYFISVSAKHKMYNFKAIKMKTE